MLDFLFGEYGLRFLIAFVVVLLVIAVGVWVARRFGAERLGGTGARGRQPRLAVIDAATVDSRRRLILIRRDNVEHLLMIGGPTDVVVEANIVRAAQQRDTAPMRPPAAPEAPARTAPLGDGSTWPLQPEPAPAALPPPRPQRPMPIPTPTPTVEEPAQWQAEAEQQPSPAPVRQPRQPVDPLAGLAAELSRQPPPTPPTRLPREREPSRERETSRELLREREPPREREAVREREPSREREPEPPREAIRERGIARDREPPREREAARLAQAAQQAQPAVQAEGQFGAAADQNLADMAQRLEAALRRPGKPDAATDAKLKAPNVEPMVQAPPAEPMVVAAAEPIALEPRAARGEGKPVREARAGGQRSSMYDSLEQEMASLLGRPGKN